MLRLFGQPIDARDAVELVAALRADGRPDAVVAAAAIEAALPADTSDLVLTPEQRNAVGSVLEKTRRLWKLRDLADTAGD